MLFLIVCVITVFSMKNAAGGLEKEFISSWDFSNQYNWKKSILPCSGRSVYFGKKPRQSVYVDKSLSMSSIHLDHDVQIVFADDVNLNFVSEKSSRCVGAGDESIFENRAPGYWWDPNSWRCTSRDILECNIAVPDLYRVPCQRDIVRFKNPRESMYKIIFSPPERIVLEMYIGSKNMSTLSLTAFAQTDEGKSVMTKTHGSSSTYAYIEKDGSCSSDTGCQCHQNDPLAQICTVAQFPEAQCSNPVKMDGFCCPTCGADISISINGTLRKDDVKSVLKDTLKMKSMDGLKGHVALDRSGKFYHIYLLAGTPGADYISGADIVSSAISSALDENNNHRISSAVAGSSFAAELMRSETNSSVGSVFLALFLIIICVFIVIFLYKRRSRMSLSNFDFRRVSLRSRRDSTLSTITLTQSVTEPGVRFSNPMYSVPEVIVETEEGLAEVPEIVTPENPTQRSNPLFEAHQQGHAVSLSQLRETDEEFHDPEIREKMESSEKLPPVQEENCGTLLTGIHDTPKEDNSLASNETELNIFHDSALSSEDP